MEFRRVLFRSVVESDLLLYDIAAGSPTFGKLLGRVGLGGGETISAAFDPDRKKDLKKMNGVQTCALPICGRERPPPLRHRSGLADVRQAPRPGGPRGERDVRGGIRSRSEERSEENEWSSDVCSSDLWSRATSSSTTSQRARRRSASSSAGWASGGARRSRRHSI